MTHSDSITLLLLDLKPSDLHFPSEDFFRLDFTKLTGKHEAQVYTASFRPKQTTCPACGVISKTRHVRAYTKFHSAKSPF